MALFDWLSETTGPVVKGETVTLRKTVRIDYLVAGDPRPSGTQTYPAVSRGWIFR